MADIFLIAFTGMLLYTVVDMPDFQNSQQSKKIEEIRAREEEAFMQRAAGRFGLAYIDLSGANIETDALMTIPEDEARYAQIAPFKIVGKDLYVGVKSPNLPATKQILEKLAGQYRLGVHMVSMRSLEKAWDRYQDISHALMSQGGMLDISGDELQRIAEEIRTNADVAHRFKDILSSEGGKKTTRLMEIIFGAAIATKTSDVHIEAQDEQVRLRFRQDGVLQDIVDFDHESYKKLLSRIKLLSEMKITQTENAQDGRFTIDFDGKEIEVRVSVIPSAYGESFVMRILNPDGIRVGIEQLGIEPRLYEILMKEIKKPNGMILTTGPTGSGKTTTLYSFMNRVSNPEVKILTIEDPIEYHLAGISQTQVNRARGYDFLSGLRAALRQDPDVVMVGEIRDGETASIAVNASLTGHLVLSTLHTNSAAGVIPRLIDLGISPQILAASLSVSIAQRLVRKVCESCRDVESATPEQERQIRDILHTAKYNNKPLHEYGVDVNQDIKLTVGRGCEKCNGTGYKGRIGLFEAIITDETIEELLNQHPSEQDVRRVAEKQGLLNMREDGIVKILNGITSMEEVQKVIDLELRGVGDTELIVDGVTILGADEVGAENRLEASDPVVWNTTDDNPVSAESQISEARLSGLQGIDPTALFGAKSLEISLLIDYLKKLEEEQIVNPEKDITLQIKQVQVTILDLLKQVNAEHIFQSDGNFSKTHTTFNRLADDLEEMHQHQNKNPHVDMSEKIRRIREEIEHHDVLKKTTL